MLHLLDLYRQLHILTYQHTMENTPTKRPRSAFAATCYNCARSGILPNSIELLVDEFGNRFCSHECAWSSRLSNNNNNEKERYTKERLTEEEELRAKRLDAANLQRVQQLLKKQSAARRRRVQRNSNKSSQAVVQLQQKQVPAVAQETPQPAYGLHVFSHLFSAPEE